MPKDTFSIGRLTTPRVIGTAIVLALIVGAGAAAVSRADTGATDDNEPQVVIQTVETALLKLACDIQQSRTYTGIITAKRSADLGFERGARLTAIHFDDGDVVQASQPIATLDIRRLESRRRELVARHNAAEALLAEFNAGPRKETIEAARAEVADLNSQLELRQRNYRRTEKLRRQNAATDQDIDTSESFLQSTEARLNAAQKRLDELEAGTRAEQVQAQQANVEQLVAMLQDVDIELDNSILKAPFTGQVAARYLDEGTVVSPGQPVVRLVEHQALEARIGLPLQVVNSLSMGDSIELSCGDIACTGMLSRMLPEIDLATRTQTVVIEIDRSQSPEVVPGQVVQTSITQQVDKQGFLLPTAALLPGVRGLWSVYAVIQDNGQDVIQRRHVEVLHTSGDQVLVQGTVAEGDRVVISGVQRLVSGQRVRVVK